MVSDMERYCFTEKELSGSKLKVCPYIRVDTFTMMECAKNYAPSNLVECEGVVKEMLPLFPECEAEIQELFSTRSDEDYAESDKDMYYDILDYSFSSKLVDLDVYLNIYYTLLYKQNRDCYTPFTETRWTSEQIKKIREKRKDCKKYIKEHPKKVIPFIIKEENIETFKEAKIQDFAPNVSRLYYLSSKFRLLFTDTEKANAGKYSYEEMRGIFVSDDISVNRIEEIWLCEYLVGINLAMMFYSFFNPILKDIGFPVIEKELREIICKIIREIMKVDGIYTRCLLVHKLKIIYEIKLKSELFNSKFNYKELLYYIYEEILHKRMTVYVETMDQLKREVLDYGNTEELEKIFLKELEESSESLIREHLGCSDGYYLLKKLSKVTVGEKDRMYMLIQKIILSERKEWVLS